MIKTQKILITGGIHGDEPIGIEVAKFFEKGRNSILGLVCNPKALRENKRFIETDLNRSFGVNKPISLEENRARKISEIVKNFDLIIDLHNTKACGTTCAIVVNKPNDLQLLLAKYFSFDKVVIMPSSGSLISKKPNKSISLEVADDSLKKFSGKFFIEKIEALNERLGVSDNLKKCLRIYSFINRVQKTTLERMSIKKTDLSNFKKITNAQNKKFCLGKGDYYPIFLKDKDEEVAFTLVKEIEVK